MRNVSIYIDFGSTFTKAAAFDQEAVELLSWAKAPSTVDTDVTIGLRNVLELLAEHVHFTEADVRRACACSSAAGGLCVICVGLTPELSAQAGRLAAFGAGAKIAGTYAHELTQENLSEIEDLAPDIVLLSGGIDGGDRKALTHNAQMLASTGDRVKNILVAGNKSAYDDVDAALGQTGKNIIFAKNVLPELNRMELGHINKQIRTMFLAHITQAKGIDRAERLIGKILMPTPSAVLEAARIASKGIPNTEDGLGDLLLVDVGGATTDIYSMCDGLPTIPGVNLVGLQEPFSKRTVEGDLGLFHNLDVLTGMAADERPSKDKGSSLLKQITAEFQRAYGIPSSEIQREKHLLLTRLAVKAATDRHCGQLYPLGNGNDTRAVQRGKDLTKVRTVIGAGGPIIFSSDPRIVLKGAVQIQDEQQFLKPADPQFYLDKQYILFAAGLMAQVDPVSALRVIKKNLQKL